MNSLGETLKQLRVARGKKRSPLAKKLGVSTEYLRLVESGRRMPSADLVKKMCEALPLPPFEAFALKYEFLRIKFAGEASELVDLEEVSAFADLFVQEFKQYVDEVMTEAEIPVDRKVENSNYLLGVVHFVVKKVTGQLLHVEEDEE